MSPHDFPMLESALALSVLGAPILLLATKLSGGDSLGLPFRLSLWVLAGIALGVARSGFGHWALLVGLGTPDWRTPVAAVAAVVTTLAAWPIVQRRQERAGKPTISENEAFLEITARPIRYRLFLVVTAAVTEEILYRGFAIGVGGEILGNRSAAVALSLATFVAAHFRWGLVHMFSVLWAAIALTTLFLITHDLWACIAAHGAIDLIGLVIAPAALRPVAAASPTDRTTRTR